MTSQIKGYEIYPDPIFSARPWIPPLGFNPQTGDPRPNKNRKNRAKIKAARKQNKQRKNR